MTPDFLYQALNGHVFRPDGAFIIESLITVKALGVCSGTEIIVSHPQDQFEILAVPQNAAVARTRVKNAASAYGFDSIALDEFEVAIGEAVTNAILYGAPSADSAILVRYEFDPDRQVFAVEVHDRGQGFDPNKLAPLEDKEALGGRGIGLMQVLADDVQLFHDGMGMVVRLEKKLHH